MVKHSIPADSYTTKLSYTISYMFAILFFCALCKLCNLVYELKFIIIIITIMWEVLLKTTYGANFPTL